MGKFWTGVARFFAVIFSIAFVLTAILALVLNDVDRWLLASATYKNAPAHPIMRLGLDLPMFFLLLISFLAVRTLKGWLRWWGIPIFVTGLFSVGLGVSLSTFFKQAWVTLLANRIPDSVSLGVITLGHDMLRAILQTFLAGLIISGTLLLVLGLGMWIGSSFIKEKVAPAAPAGPAPAAS